MKNLIILISFILGIIPNIILAQENPLNPFIENFIELEQQINDNSSDIDGLEARVTDLEARVLELETPKEILLVVRTQSDMDGRNRDLYLMLLTLGNVEVIGDRKTNRPLTVAKAEAADLIVISDDISELEMNKVDVAVPSGFSENQILKNTTTPLMIASELILNELGFGVELMRVSDFSVLTNSVITMGMFFNQRIGGSYASTQMSPDALILASTDHPTNAFGAAWIYLAGTETADNFILPGIRAGFPYHGNSGSAIVYVIAREMAKFILALP